MVNRYDDHSNLCFAFFRQNFFLSQIFKSKIFVETFFVKSFDESKNLYGIMPKLLKENGLLSYRAGDLISVCPPLLINKDEIDFIVEGIRSSILELEKI